MDGDKLQKEDYDKARELVKNSDGKWMKYADRILNEVDPHVVKMTALNLGFEAFFLWGTKRINQMRKYITVISLAAGGSHQCMQPSLYRLLGC